MNSGHLRNDTASGLWAVRLAQQVDLPVLAAVELAASSRFSASELPPERFGKTLGQRRLRQAMAQSLLWVADEPAAVVGFLAATVVPGAIHVLEISVLPDFGRRGIGTALLASVEQAARERGVPALTLTTFSHVAWNGPAYAKLGFQAVPEAALTAALRHRLAAEAAGGLAHRVAMRRNVA